MSQLPSGRSDRAIFGATDHRQLTVMVDPNILGEQLSQIVKIIMNFF